MSVLTPQKLRFIEEYLIDPTSLTKAALRAGYAASSACQSGHRIMQQPEVKAAIEEGQKARAEKIGITQDRVLQELALIAFANLKDIITQDAEGNTTVDMNGLTRETAAALGEFSVTTKGGRTKTQTSRIKLSDKIAALEKIGRHLGMFKEKIEHTGVLTLEQLVYQSMEDEPQEGV